MQGRKFFTLIITLFLSSISVFASTHDNHSADGVNEEMSEEEESSLRKTMIKAYINHHLEDSHSFDLYSYTNDEGEHEYAGFALPVILIDGGVKVFMSSEFEHGEKVVEKGGNYYRLYHGKIYKTDAHGTIEYDDDHKVVNEAPLDLSITKNVVFIMLILGMIFFIFRGMARAYAKSDDLMPRGAGRILEPIILFIRDDIAIPNIGEKHYKRFMPYLLTVFFFIWIVNLFGLTPLGVNVTNSIAVTLCLALLTFLITTFSANGAYWKHIFWMPGVPVFMKIVLAPIELLGIFIKPFSLMIRLFANITAGHVVLMSLMAMIIYNSWLGSTLSFVLTAALGGLEILVAVLQAYIFTMLSALYFGSAVEDHSHEHEHAH